MVDFEDVFEAYKTLEEEPGKWIKLGVQYKRHNPGSPQKVF